MSVTVNPPTGCGDLPPIKMNVNSGKRQVEGVHPQGIMNVTSGPKTDETLRQKTHGRTAPLQRQTSRKTSSTIN